VIFYLSNRRKEGKAKSEADIVLEEIETMVRRRYVPIVGREKGRFLYLLVKASGASKVLELGAAVGYSTIWLAKAVGPRGRILSIEVDEDYCGEARENVERAGLSEVVEIIHGDAVDVLPRLDGTFDFIFLDADKGDYVRLFEPCISHLRSGGVLAADNAGMVWSYNELAMNDERVETMIIPIRDGITLTVKK
jgi:predicted O-methyltransferase YrrM